MSETQDYARIPAHTYKDFGKTAWWNAKSRLCDGVHGYGRTKSEALNDLADGIARAARIASHRRYIVCNDGTVLVVAEGFYDIVHTNGRYSSCSTGDTFQQTYDYALRHAAESYDGQVDSAVAS